MEEQEWLTAEQVAEILRVSLRHAYRYGEDGKIVTRKAGRRIQFSRASVEELAAELNVEIKPPARPQKTDLLPASELLEYLKQVQDQLNTALLSIGRLQGQLDQRLLPEDEQNLKQRITELEQEREAIEAERSALQAEVERLKRPWWKRLIGD